MSAGGAPRTPASTRAAFVSVIMSRVSPSSSGSTRKATSSTISSKVPPKSEREHQTPVRITSQPGEDFYPVHNHRLDNDAREIAARGGNFELLHQFAECNPDLLGTSQVQPD